MYSQRHASTINIPVPPLGQRKPWHDVRIKGNRTSNATIHGKSSSADGAAVWRTVLKTLHHSLSINAWLYRSQLRLREMKWEYLTSDDDRSSFVPRPLGDRMRMSRAPIRVIWNLGFVRPTARWHHSRGAVLRFLFTRATFASRWIRSAQ